MIAQFLWLLSRRCALPRRSAAALLGVFLPLLAGCSSYTTVTKLSSAPNPSTVGQSVSLKATVGVPSHSIIDFPIFTTLSPVPGGTVSLMDASTAPATLLDTEPVSNGIANFNIATLIPGTHTLTATFNGYSTSYEAGGGDGLGGGYLVTTTYKTSTSSPLTQIVDNPNGLATTTVLTSSLHPSGYGQSVTFTAAVTPNGPATAAPTGSVTFTEGNAILATVPLSSGAAAFTTSTLPIGADTIIAYYTGDSNFATSSGSLVQTVKLVLQTALTSSLNPSVVSQSVIFTAAVTSNGGTPTGTVQFAIDGTNVGSSVILDASGKATDTETSLTQGTHTVTVTYNSTGNFVGAPGSTTASVTQTVNPLTTQTSLTSSLTPSVVSQAVTFTAAVTSNGGTPTGSVQFTIDGTNVGGPVTLDANGQAADTETGLTAGTHTVTVVYAPNGAFIGATGNLTASVTQSVQLHLSPQYVSPTGNDANDGSSAHPKQTVQAAVNVTLSGDTVIIEDGTYTGSGNRDINFGGRNITVTSQTGPAATIIDCGGSSNANHRGFFFHSGETSAVVSGVTIQNGNESGSNTDAANPSGSGGAVAVASGSAATLTNCVLRNNYANCGGGLYCYGSLILNACIVTGNIMEGAYYNGGGGLFNLGSVSAVNCAFTDNSADGYGGGVTNSGPAQFTNCTFTGNRATAQGTGLFNNGTLTLTNDIFYGDGQGEIQYDAGTVTATYSDIQDNYVGAGNIDAGAGDIDADPKFVDAAAGDFHLQPGSPCLGAGTASGAPAADMDGTSRPNPPAIGAYEKAAPSTHVLWNNADNGQVSIWNYDPLTGAFGYRDYGPYPGWTAQAIADGPDALTRVLWNHTSGLMSLWSLDNALPGGAFTQFTFGPYPNWTAKAVSVGTDNTTHVLWTHSPDGQVSLWNYDTGSGGFTYQDYGPYGGWTAQALADGADGKTRVLWDNADGRMSLWSLDNRAGLFTQNTFGPYPGWTATALSVGLDNTTHVLWTNASGQVSLWNYDTGSGGFTYQDYGPYGGWTAQALADGADGKTRLLWDNAGGAMSLWSLDNRAGVFTQNTYGPYSGWNAVAVSAP